MSKQVTLTRTRLIEERIIHEVAAEDPEDAIAATEYLLNGNKLPWKYIRTLQTVLPVVDVKEIQSKRGAKMGAPIEDPKPTKVNETPTQPVVPTPTEDTPKE